jgi:pimeloyl-ACP methyl ester carboxylesterase
VHFKNASRLAEHHDVVLVGYRGVDGSTRLDCPEVSSSREHSPDLLGERSFRADAAAYRSCADRLRSNGVDLRGYSIPERVDDLELARHDLGYQRIDLVSESAGTRTAMIYAWRYPRSIHRSVMIGVNPPGNFLWDAKTTGEQIRRYASLCAQDTSCRNRTPDLAASLGSAFAHVPGHWLFLPIKKGDAKAAAFFGLINETSDGGGPIASPLTIDTLLSADKGDASGAWFLSLMAQLVFPHAQVWGDVAAIARSDATYAKDFFASGADRGSLIGAPGTDLIWAGGRILDAWPANPDENEYTHVQDSNVETLLIGGNLDFATPPENATRELLPHLANGRQVVLSNLGHADDFWPYEPAASTRLLNTYLDTGKVDTSLYTRNKVDFSPSSSQGAYAKDLLGAMMGFGLLMILSLPLMWRRAHKRGGFGRKASALLRSVYPLVLGLGGWFTGLIIVLAALPTVPLDSELMAVLSIGTPIGLGTYWAWVNRDRPARATTIGIWVALTGALVGALLGFNATSGLIAVITTILGAAAGANLGLIALDVARIGERPETVPPIAIPAVEH